MTELVISTESVVDFLVGLLNTPSPTGYAPQAIEYAREAFAGLDLPGLTLTITSKGALVISLPGAKHDAPRGLTAHVDTLGLMVKEIKGSGRLKVTNLGGIMWGGIEFEGVTVRTQDGRLYRGSVLAGQCQRARQPPHPHRGAQRRYDGDPAGRARDQRRRHARAGDRGRGLRLPRSARGGQRQRVRAQPLPGRQGRGGLHLRGAAGATRRRANPPPRTSRS